MQSYAILTSLTPRKAPADPMGPLGFVPAKLLEHIWKAHLELLGPGVELKYGLHFRRQSHPVPVGA